MTKQFTRFTTLRGGARLRRGSLLPVGNHGASLAEYGMLVGLIGVVAIGAVAATGAQITGIFEDTTAELKLAQLIATAERVHYLPTGEVFPAQDCFEGTAGADIVVAPDPDGLRADCFDGMGGADIFDLTSAPARDILLYLGQDGQVAHLPAGNHMIVGPHVLSGNTDISIDSGLSLIDLRPFVYAALDIAPSSSTDLEIILPSGGSVNLVDQFPDENVGRFVFADGEFSSAELRALAVAQQATPNADNIIGTAMDDIISPLSGNDNVFHNQGDDRIIYSSGQDTIFADQGSGFDTLDLSKYAISEVSFADDWGGSAITITTPHGFVRLTQQNSYPVGSSLVNIEQVVFSDTIITDSQLRALAN